MFWNSCCVMQMGAQGKATVCCILSVHRCHTFSIKPASLRSKLLSLCSAGVCNKLSRLFGAGQTIALHMTNDVQVRACAMQAYKSAMLMLYRHGIIIAAHLLLCPIPVVVICAGLLLVSMSSWFYRMQARLSYCKCPCDAAANSAVHQRAHIMQAVVPHCSALMHFCPSFGPAHQSCSQL